jgi:hypothetical protein
MHIENTKLKYNQTIVTWKGLHQHPIRNLAAHRGAGMAFAMFFSSSTCQASKKNLLSTTKRKYKHKHTFSWSLGVYL